MRPNRTQGWRGKAEGRETKGLVPKKWAGETAVIVASGSSLTQEDVEKVQGLKTLVINNNWTVAPWADVLYACDGKWWDCEERGYGQDALAAFGGEFWTQDQGAAEKYGINWVRSEKTDGLCTEPDLIHTGGNSGHQAINLLYHFGAARIGLLGYDMKGRHHHPDHPPGLNNPSPSTFRRWLTAFRALAADCEAVGLEVVNLSPDTALESFPRETVDKFMGRVRAGTAAG